ncbi:MULTISPECIES: hypothetical protein [unclassified Streptomyces]|uniref:hypothetical protein n=1 Tax=unclassified Streptomyces TaxID=2593676 RepID=UPI000DC79CE4|nr:MULTISPECIES: hypothetical protein [unclassified Streptomyces]AWZ06575.1 hypothetical protein DRB89_20305 [Streptomyces sp. ICC4]AWZ11594.1 hypothetical protein DRB96_03885 [Streptomyces sp. ICC1]
MGTDIYGFIECRWDRWLDEDDRSWNKAADISDLYNGRSYVAFGSLFGVRDTTSFRPLADCRGLPPDASAESRAAVESWGSDSRGASWITWAELAAVDWDEVANEVDDCVHEYHRGPDGGWELYGRNSDLARFAVLAGITDPQALYRAGRTYPEGTEWPDDDRLFRVARLRRKDAVPDSDWGAVWAVMRTLAGLHGDEGVRLVVWFG